MAQSLGVAWVWSLGGLERAGLAPGLLHEAVAVLPAWLGALSASQGPQSRAFNNRSGLAKTPGAIVC